MPGSSNCSHSSGFSTKNLYTPFLSPFMLHVHQSQSSPFDHQTKFGEQYRSLTLSLFSFVHSPVTSSLLGPNILLNTLFSNTLSVDFSHNLNDQLSHSYTTTGQIIFLYILIFEFLDSKVEDENSAPNDSKNSLTSICS